MVVVTKASPHQIRIAFRIKVAVHYQAQPVCTVAISDEPEVEQL